MKMKPANRDEINDAFKQAHIFVSINGHYSNNKFEVTSAIAEYILYTKRLKIETKNESSQHR